MEDKGVEDSPSWKASMKKNEGKVERTCVRCGHVIKLVHCADSGCPWCAKCGANSVESKPKKGRRQSD